MDFSSLDNFFSLKIQERNAALYQWGQNHLLSLTGKELEKACSELMQYFRNHPEQQLCKNLITPDLYWKHHGDKPTHYQLNYGFKEYVMNVLIYKECDYISFDDNNNIVWDGDKKKIRFIYKDSQDRKTQPNKKLESGFSLKQKDIIWAGIAIGFLDVEVPEKTSKKTSKKEKQLNDEELDKENIENKATKNDIKKKTKQSSIKNKDNILDNSSFKEDTLTQEEIVQEYCHTNNAALTTKEPLEKNSQSSIRSKKVTEQIVKEDNIILPSAKQPKPKKK